VAEPFLVFLPFARRGVAAAVTAPLDNLDGNPLHEHPHFDVTIQLASEVGLVEVDSSQRMLDSGSVTGLDPAVVVRTDPAPGATDFLPINLASVELGVPDLPWMFTPSAPAGRPPRLRPWLALAVVDLEREAAWQPSTHPLPRLTVHVDALPDHRDLWAWAHVQYSLDGDPTVPPGDATLRSARPPVARLVCPRRLEPGRTYLAVLVPTFEAGRLAGLGKQQQIPDGAAQRTRPAWTIGSGPVDLPVYYSWQFTTASGETADFEELASRLRPARPEECRQLQPAPVDVTNPLGSTPAPAQPQTLRLATALRFAGDLDDDSSELADWDPTELQSFRDRLRTLLDLPAAAVDPVVTPPIYGANHVRVERVGPPPWIEQLNLDARFRIAAGLGSQYVREAQERLMQLAWEQLDAVNARMRLRRMTELALTVGDRQHDRHVAALPDEQLARFAAPAAPRLPVELGESDLPGLSAEPRAEVPGVRTLAGAAGATSLPADAFTATFAKLVRPQATVARRFGRGTSGLTVLANGLRNALAAPAADSAEVPSVAFAPTVLPPVQDPPPPDPLSLAADQAVESLGDVTGTAGTLPDMPVGEPVPETPSPVTLAARPGMEAPLAETLRDGTHPARTILGRFAARAGLVHSAGPELTTVLTGPEFPAPMAAVLAASHPDWLLPGLTSVPEERVTLLETNPRWVEAFLVGLNQELNRELLWREYPGELRGSAFTRFWPRDDDAPDIVPMASWTDARPLGAHGPAATGVASQVVLLVRGSLLRRFPDVTLYARPAVRVKQDDLLFFDEDENAQAIPHDFALRLGDDTVAYGFPIAESLALGQDPGGAGVVFVFEQPPHQPWFGLDAERPSGTSAPEPFWDNVSWSDVKALPRPNGAVFADARRDLAHQPVRWGTGADAAGFAYATLQRPVKMIFHASDLVVAPVAADPDQDAGQRVVGRFTAGFGPHALRREP
jgi:hypothetical protein